MKRILFFTVAAMIIVGCKTVEYVPVVEHEVHHDSIYFTKVQYDSIYAKDSTNQKEYTRGDTVFIERLMWQTKYKYKLVHDTLYQAKIDSIPAPYPVEKIVEKQLSGWQNFRLWLGNIALAIGAIAIGWGLIRWRMRFLKSL